MPKKEKKIVQVSDDSKDTDDYTLDENRRIVKVEERKDPKGDAKKYRIGAIVCWILAIVMEVIAILRLTGKIDLFASMSIMAFLILFIVLDLVFFIPGSLLWKKANHVDPMSEKDKTKFWIWNNLGTILSVLAFLPIIIFVFTNKDLDGKQKGIVGAVAIVALLAAGITSYDFNPVSAEQLARAEKEVEAVGTKDEDGKYKVYWAEHSKKYHVDPDCPAFSRSEKVYKGTVAQAYERNLTDPCRRCIPELEDDK